MNRLYSAECVTAVKETARRNLVIAVFGTEVCLTMSALQVLADGYFVCAVEDTSGGMSAGPHRAGLRRIAQAGACR